jgi:hypothetical protein
VITKLMQVCLFVRFISESPFNMGASFELGRLRSLTGRCGTPRCDGAIAVACRAK